MLGGIWADLADLVLPADCAGCRIRRSGLRHGVCPDCVTALRALRPRAVRPVPAPPGLPPCHALGTYGGPLRETLLAYKEHGRHAVARPLGALLAEVVAAAVGPVRPVLLVPVPDTARAARARYGDHLGRLTRHCARRLRAAGWPVRVYRPLRALPRPDSVTLDSAGRAAVAATAFQVRPGVLAAPPGSSVVLLDDIVTTGSTLAAVSHVLSLRGLSPAVAAVLAATEKRHQR
ncbi:Predicted amidophosphoribosyltransferases [Micromonospora phaseoli]|uniref:Predicted amidophosphoribosyltransferases n=1 Tax=Micromonospora phaseoli TaxID=1144548 RepID=A0A1H7A254_9ACTN|nr:phosphoribosyltransferase [Micromonospora phaseoli]PZV96920.1 putative amidophosphoribosyltransferase [Micromonospora phaseoli]GIJ77896.1 phosphoribosyltransferase [Micromonospora phaseoli]SEJ58976.1 Predicted amidophosphoribosyltransferases [Micromonospora phaseoli]